MSEDCKSFSEREGYRQPKPLQLESMDDDLRTGLWNAFYNSFPDYQETRYPYVYNCRHPIYSAIWQDHLHQPADEYSRFRTSPTFVKVIFQSAKWREIFDLIEFCLPKLKPLHDALSPAAAGRRALLDAAIFEYRCNQVLEKENAAYRITKGWVTPITSEQEIEAIETALQCPYGPANEHIEKALALVSDRENPDYENSIKESISAVESIAKEVTGDSKATLGKLTERLNLHPAFQDGLNKLYGFTSDVGGIRHAGASHKSAEHPKPDQATARFMLVLCSSFVNYIISQHPE